MTHKHLSAILTMLLALAGGGFATRGMAASNSAPALVPVTAGFSFAGRLGVANGTYNLRFQLWDAASAGRLVGSPNTITANLPVVNQQYEAVLNFGATAFRGDARFVEVGWRPASSTAGYTLIAPRTALLATPYALHSTSTGALRGRQVSTAAPAVGQVLKWTGAQWAPATDSDSGDITGVEAGEGLQGGAAAGSAKLSVLFGGSGSAPSAARSDHNHFNMTWTGATGGSGFSVANTSATGGNGVYGSTASDLTGANGFGGVKGVNTNTGNINGYGVVGITSSGAGAGVGGFAGTGTSAGVLGYAANNRSPAVYGQHVGNGTGVRGTTAGYGVGVHGRATGGGYGVLAQGDGSGNSIALKISGGGISVEGDLDTEGPVFVHQATRENRCRDIDNTTIIDNPHANDNPGAILLVTQNYGRVLDDHSVLSVAVIYDYGYQVDSAPRCATGRWIIKANGCVSACGIGGYDDYDFNVMVIDS